MSWSACSPPVPPCRRTDPRYWRAAKIALAGSPNPSAPSTKVYELRVYHCNPGKLDALLTRFREHTTKLFEKHGMTNIGYWVPREQPNTLTYVLAYPSREAATKSWDAFRKDPDWIAARTASEAKGPLVVKVVSVFMDPADFSALK